MRKKQVLSLFVWVEELFWQSASCRSVESVCVGSDSVLLACLLRDCSQISSKDGWLKPPILWKKQETSFLTCTPCFYIGSLKWFKLFEWRDFAFWNKGWEKAYRAGQHNFLFCIRLLICFFMEVFKSIYYIITPTNSLQLYWLSRSFGRLRAL